MRSDRRPGPEAPRRSPLRDERGMLLVVTMIILLVVSTLAATSLINAFLERSLARNQNYASIALNAADGGIQDGLAWLNDNTNLPTIPTTGTWTRPGDPTPPTELASGAAYTVKLSFKVDTDDGDCDGDVTEVVYFNKAGLSSRPRPCATPGTPEPLNDGYFAYPSALFEAASGLDKGYPVVTINAKGYLGTLAANRGYREIELDVARNKFLAQVDGAFTARAGVSASGASMTDGRNHDLTGALAPGGTGCMADKPGILYDDGVTPTESCPNANIIGSPCVANYDPTAKGPLGRTPWGVLGISEDNFRDMFTERTNNLLDMTSCYPEKNFVWFSGDYTEPVNPANPTDTTWNCLLHGTCVQYNNSAPCLNYGGILVVHNRNFDPDQWESRCGVGSTDAYCTVDADADGNRDNAPAVFNMNGNIQWTGIVIADQVVKVNGTPTILGGVLSLASGGKIMSDVTGNINIKYSCEAVQGVVHQGYKTRLGWHRIR